VSSGLRQLLGGTIPEPDALVGAGAGVGGEAGSIVGGLAAGGAAGGAVTQIAAAGSSQVAAGGLAYLGAGHKYLWGSASPSKGWDCSGFVNWVVGHDLGLPIPGYTSTRFDGRGHGPTTGTWALWSGAVSVPASQIAPGDLIIWPLNHMGIAIDGQTMVHAPGPNGTPAPVIGRIYAGRVGPMLVRRIRGT
jgi:cell wall-associated NlpC family hydrolase